MKTPYRRSPKYVITGTDLISAVTGLHADAGRHSQRQHVWVVSPADLIYIYWPSWPAKVRAWAELQLASTGPLTRGLCPLTPWAYRLIDGS